MQVLTATNSVQFVLALDQKSPLGNPHFHLFCEDSGTFEATDPGLVDMVIVPASVDVIASIALIPPGFAVLVDKRLGAAIDFEGAGRNALFKNCNLPTWHPS